MCLDYAEMQANNRKMTELFPKHGGFRKLPARSILEGMQRTGKHKGIREKREDVKVIFGGS
jgi:hypothetical protein